MQPLGIGCLFRKDRKHDKGTKGNFVGLDTTMTNVGIRVYDPETKSILSVPEIKICKILDNNSYNFDTDAFEQQELLEDSESMTEEESEEADSDENNECSSTSSSSSSQSSEESDPVRNDVKLRRESENRLPSEVNLTDVTESEVSSELSEEESKQEIATNEDDDEMKSISEGSESSQEPEKNDSKKESKVPIDSLQSLGTSANTVRNFQMQNIKAEAEIAITMNPTDPPDQLVAFMRQVKSIVKDADISSVLDKDGIMILARKHKWRLDDIVGGLGIDAHKALEKMAVVRAKDEYEQEARLEAVFKELLQVLLTGTVQKMPDFDPKNPPKEKFISVQLLLARKDGETGEEIKSRAVKRGDTEKPKIDFDPKEISTSMPSLTEIVIADHWCVTQGQEPKQKDAITAFLYTFITGPGRILLKAIPGITGLQPGEPLEQRRELYGGHNAPRAFETQRNDKQLQLGYIESDITAPNLRVKVNKDGTRQIMLSYVDDMRGAADTPEGMTEVEKDFKDLAKTYPLKDVSNQRFLSVNNKWDLDKKQVSYNVRPFIEQAAKKYGVLDQPSHRLPMDPEMEISIGQPDDVCDRKEYNEIVGVLAWAIRKQFPALSVYHNVLSRYLAHPTQKWYKQARRVPKWLYDHRDSEWLINAADEMEADLVCYCDASHNDCKNTGATTMGYVIVLNGTVIATKSRKKDSIVGSNTVNEQRSLHESVGELLRAQRILESLGWVFRKPPGIVGDNKGSLSQCTSAKMTEIHKTLKTKYLQLRQLYSKSKLRIGYVPTGHNHADLMTKIHFTQKLFEYHLNAIQKGECSLDHIEWYD